MSGPSRAQQTGSIKKPQLGGSSLRHSSARGLNPASQESARAYLSAARKALNTSPTGSIRSRGTAPSSPSGTKRKDRDFDERDDETNISVVVRCRGRNEREIKENSGVIISTPGGLRGREVAVSMGPSALNNKLYTFDRVFPPEADQSMVYEDVVHPLLTEMLSGYNCTIFAYGQTGTGKTYTMSGDVSDHFGTHADSAGIIPRALYRLFTELATENIEYTVKCSFIELYNEELRDLLSSEQETKLKIFDDSTRKGIIIQGMEESYIKSAEEGVKLLQTGSLRRQVAATKCNDHSSRSHSVFTITVHAGGVGDDGESYLRTGKLNLVDLAGSENIGRSGAADKRAREAGIINQSLLTLGRVINALVDKSQHIPYRESKLTRLLQDSLGGRTKTCIIATISPAKINLEETISTLDYATRAKNIRNKPQVNQMMTKKALIKEYVLEIEKLKGDLAAARQKNGVFLTQESFQEMTEESESRRILAEEQARKIEVLEIQLSSTRERFEANMRTFMETKKELEGTNRALADTKSTLEFTETNLANTKQNLKEETVLRKAHQNTEGNLDVIGRNLISTVGATVSDIGGLHEKIERKVKLHETNRDIWARSATQVKDVTTLVEDKISQFTEEHYRLSDTISTKLSDFINAELSQLNTTYEFINQKSEIFNDMETELSTETKSTKEDMNQVLESMKVLRDDIKHRVNEGLKGLNKEAEKIADEVISELVAFNEQLHDTFTFIGRELKGTFDNTTKHLATQKLEIDLLRSHLTKATTAANTANLTAKEALEKILSEEREKAAVERQNLLSQISALVNSTAENQDKRWTEKIGLVQSRLDTSREDLEAAATQSGQRFTTWLEDEEKFIKEMSQSRDHLKQALVRDWENAENKSISIQRTTKTIHAETIKLVDSQMEFVDKQMATLDSFVNEARGHNEKHHQKFTNNFSNLGGNVKESYTNVASQITELKARVDQFNKDVVSTMNLVKSSLDPFALTARKPLEALRQEVTSAELKEYIPTGETPTKRNYDYPNKLPRTKAHAEILTRLREKGTISPSATFTGGGSLDDSVLASPTINPFENEAGEFDDDLATLSEQEAQIQKKAREVLKIKRSTSADFQSGSGIPFPASTRAAAATTTAAGGNRSSAFPSNIQSFSSTPYSLGATWGPGSIPPSRTKSNCNAASTTATLKDIPVNTLDTFAKSLNHPPPSSGLLVNKNVGEGKEKKEKVAGVNSLDLQPPLKKLASGDGILMGKRVGSKGYVPGGRENVGTERKKRGV